MPDTTPAPDLPRFAAPYASSDEEIVAGLLNHPPADPAAEGRIDERATRLIRAIRDNAGSIGGIEDFLREYSLSTKEGLALMILAEALLRVPDRETADALIEDKLGQGDWAIWPVNPWNPSESNKEVASYPAKP